MLGKKTNVASFSKEKLMQVKQEYQMYRDDLAWKLFLAPAIIYFAWARALTLDGRDPAAFLGFATPSWLVALVKHLFVPTPKIAINTKLAPFMTGCVSLSQPSPRLPGTPPTPRHTPPWTTDSSLQMKKNLYAAPPPPHPPLCSSFLPFVMTAVQCLLTWTLVGYTSLALRENVLRVNGSSIRKWWIYHHYLSIVLVLAALTLPVDSAVVQEFMGPLLALIAFQGFVMIIQNWYTRRRLYAHIAVGRASAMDIAARDTRTSLLIVYPVVFAFQVYEGALGWAIFDRFWRTFLDPRGFVDYSGPECKGMGACAALVDLRAMRTLAFVGALLILLSAGNIHGTLVTLLSRILRTKRR